MQNLLTAKRHLWLEKELKRLARFEAVIIDDLGYVPPDREEMEVLFTFLAERYERKSVLISSSLVFSQWDRIFKDPPDHRRGHRPLSPSLPYFGNDRPQLPDRGSQKQESTRHRSTG